MIDIHSHTLWHLDDGSPDLDESVAMCALAADTGTKYLFLTPHLIYWDEAEDLYDRRNEKASHLRHILREEGIPLHLRTGFEILCDDEIFEIKYFQPYTLNGTRYILIEFDFFKTAEEDVRAWCRYLASFGLVPIIAHPERYGFVMNDIASIERLSKDGVLFQINAASPLGLFGGREGEVALTLLHNGYVDFIGSDAHRAHGRNTNMASLLHRYPEEVDRELVHLTANRNPRVLLHDEPLTPVRLGHLSDL